MFYFKEITYRLYFLFCLLIITALIINSYKYLLILIIFLPLTSNNQVVNIVYPDPFIMMNIYFELILMFLTFFILPFIIGEVLDFLKPGLSAKTVKNYRRQVFIVIFFILQINVIAINYIMPEVWYYIEDYVISSRVIQHLNIFLEIKLDYYYRVIKMFIFISNLIIAYIALFIYMFKSIDVANLLEFRKVTLLINLVIATIATPPDVTSQFYVFLTLTLLFEAYLFFSILLFKSKKYALIFIRYI